MKEYNIELSKNEIENDIAVDFDDLVSITKQNESDIIILKEEKSVNDLRFGFVSNQEHCSPKYYFADKNKNRLS